MQPIDDHGSTVKSNRRFQNNECSRKGRVQPAHRIKGCLVRVVMRSMIKQCQTSQRQAKASPASAGHHSLDTAGYDGEYTTCIGMPWEHEAHLRLADSFSLAVFAPSSLLSAFIPLFPLEVHRPHVARSLSWRIIMTTFLTTNQALFDYTSGWWM